MADIQQLIEADKALLLSLNGSDSLFWDGFMWTVTDTKTWIPAVLVLLYVVFKNNRVPQGIVITLMFALCVTLADQFASGLCKPYFARFRPTQDPGLMLSGADGERLSGRLVWIYLQPCRQYLCRSDVCFVAGALSAFHLHDVSVGHDSLVLTHVLRCALSWRYSVRGGGRIGCRCACVPAVRTSAQEILRLSAVYFHPVHQGRIYQG